MLILEIAGGIVLGVIALVMVRFAWGLFDAFNAPKATGFGGKVTDPSSYERIRENRRKRAEQAKAVQHG